MATGSVLDGRVHRALELYEEHGHEIEWVGPNLYLVPSSTGGKTYRVDYKRETCDCDDGFFRTNDDPELSCEHVYLVGILKAKRRSARRITGGGFLCGEGETP